MALNLSPPAPLSLAAACFLLATGGWLGEIEHGHLTDTLPTATAAGILLLGIIASRSTRRSLVALDPALLALLLLAVLELRGPFPQPRAALHSTCAAVAFMAGRGMRLESLHRRVLLAAMIVPLAHAAWQRWILFPELAPFLEGEARSRLLSGRVFSVFILPGQFSAWIACMLPIAIAAALAGPWKTLARLVTLTLMGAFALAGSLAGPACALPALAWFLGRGRALAILVILAVCALAFSIATRPETHSLSGSGSPVSLRLATWSSTLTGIQDAWGTGHGAGTFASLYVEQYRSRAADEVRHPHNWPLLLWFEHGLAGLLAWLTLASRLLQPVRDRAARAGAVAFFLATLLDVADISGTLRTLGMLLLGLSIPGPANGPPTASAP